MATSAASASQSAQLPLTGDISKKLKETKNKNASASAYPLEVRAYATCLYSWVNFPV